MVLNVERLTQKADLAKSLVEKGLAANMEEAMAKIDQEQLMRTDGDENIMSVKTDSETQKTEISGDEISQLKNHIERLKNKTEAIDGFMRKYAANNDKNLKELCGEMEKLHNRVISIRNTMSEEGVEIEKETLKTLEDKPKDEKNEEKPKKEEKEGCDKPPSRDDIDPDVYNINKIFSNSNNKMMKK